MTSPPPVIVLSNAVQQVAVIAINLVYPIVVFRAANASVDVVSNLLATAMLVLAFGTFLQVLRSGPVGSGYMCPSTFTATYFAPSLLAAKVGGLPLVSPYSSPLHGEQRTGKIEHPEMVRQFPIMDDSVELIAPNKAAGVAPEIEIDDLKRKEEATRA